MLTIVGKVKDELVANEKQVTIQRSRKFKYYLSPLRESRLGCGLAQLLG